MVGSEITQAELDAPLANVSGGWFLLGGKSIVDFQQTGEQVKGHVTLLGKAETISLTGTMTGRVVRGTAVPSDTRRPLDWAFVVSEGGETARWILNLGGKISKATYCRIALGPVSRKWPFWNDPLLSGGIIGFLPVQPDGVAVMPGTPDNVRHVLVTLHYAHDSKGDIVPVRMFVPLKVPRSAVHVVTPINQPIVAKGLHVKALREVRRNSSWYQKQSGTFEGRTYWWVMSPYWDPGSSDLDPSGVFGELYFQDPDSGALPTESVPVAVRGTDGKWNPRTSYLVKAPRPIAAQAVIEGGQPVRVETHEVQEPALKDFLGAKETYLLEAKWRNHMLIDVKNKTLPKMLQETKTSELTDLVGKVEKALLDINHEGELAKDSAQKEIEAGRPADFWREMSIIYKERIEVLKPILAAIKDEVASRGK